MPCKFCDQHCYGGHIPLEQIRLQLPELNKPSYSRRHRSLRLAVSLIILKRRGYEPLPLRRLAEMIFAKLAPKDVIALDEALREPGLHQLAAELGQTAFRPLDLNLSQLEPQS